MADRTADQRAVIAAILVLNFVGPSTFLILPVLIEGAVHDLHFTELQVGMLSFAISAGGLVSSVLSGFWVRSLSWRTSALLSLAGMLIANTACLFWHGYMQFLLLQALAVFFGGSLGSLAMTILSDGRHAARSFGLAMAVQVTYQMIGILIGPTLLHWAGVNGVVAMLGSLSVLAAPLVALVPERGRTVASGYVTRELLRVPTLLGLAACFLFFMNVGSYWTYIDLIGRDSGISAQKVANCIAIGVSAGIVGGLLASFLGERLGRLSHITLAAIITVASLLLLAKPSLHAFVLSSILYNFAWNYSLAYQLALLSAVDTTGRAVAIAGAFYLGGSASGAAIAAAFVAPHDYRIVIGLASASVLVSAGVFALSTSAHRSRLTREGALST